MARYDTALLNLLAKATDEAYERGRADMRREIAASIQAHVGDADRKPQPIRSIRIQNPRKEAVADAVLAILKAHGKPMDRSGLINALNDNGVVIQGKDPAVVLQTMLWRMKERVAHIKDHGYWLAGMPLPAAPAVVALKGRG